jgi:multidrug efflux pump
LSIRTLGLIRTPEEFENLIIREVGGNPIKIGDVGRAEFAAENERNINKYNGVPCVILAVLPQSGTNHVEISDRFRLRLEELQRDIPEDIETEIVMDTTDFVRRSISEVQETVLIAFILVVIVIFAFLRDWRTTLIPMISIPVSLIGAFFILYLFGFSINVLTLLSVVLAVSLVVDDSIVIMENIYVKIENGMSPLEAAFKGSREVFFAIVSTTIVLICVFLPVIFLSGITGRLFREFSIAVSGAVLISSFVALSLSPMLCSKILKREEKKNWFYRFTDGFFVGLTNAYSNALSMFIRVKWVAIIILVCACIGIVFIYSDLQKELAPMEDRSRLTLRISVPEGTSFESFARYVDEVSDMVQDSVIELVGMQTMVRGNFGFVRAFLTSPDQRTRTQQQIAAKLSTDVRSLTKGRIQVTQDPTIGDRRAGQGVQYVIQASSVEKLRSIIPDFLAATNRSDIFVFSDVNLKFTKPELVVSIDREKARLLNVSTTSIAQTMQLAFAGSRIGYFTMNGKQYSIICEVDKTNRNMPGNMPAMYVRNNNGAMIQLDNLLTDSIKSNTPSLFRFNRYVSATVSANMAEGYTLADGIEEMHKISKEVLDDTYKTELAGQAREFSESSSSIFFALVLALILVYLVLAAQFESFRDPIVIMCSVICAGLGALFSLWLFNQTFNIFSQIGIIMLIGLITKNGILSVEFSNQRRDDGYSVLKSVKDAAISRFRPILMTGFTTVFGFMPIALALGAGAESRISMGVAVVGGMFIGTLLTLFVIPAMYVFISGKRKMIDETKYL